MSQGCVRVCGGGVDGIYFIFFCREYRPFKFSPSWNASTEYQVSKIYDKFSSSENSFSYTWSMFVNNCYLKRKLIMRDFFAHKCCMFNQRHSYNYVEHFKVTFLEGTVSEDTTLLLWCDDSDMNNEHTKLNIVAMFSSSFTNKRKASFPLNSLILWAYKI